jgi:hypothetical protein
VINSLPPVIGLPVGMVVANPAAAHGGGDDAPEASRARQYVVLAQAVLSALRPAESETSE